MKAQTKDRISSIVVIALLAAGLVGYINTLFAKLNIIDLKRENQEIQKQYEQLWSALYDNQVRINGIADIQRQQAEIVIQTADKINGAVVVGFTNKEAFVQGFHDQMKRREAYISE